MYDIMVSNFTNSTEHKIWPQKNFQNKMEPRYLLLAVEIQLEFRFRLILSTLLPT